MGNIFQQDPQDYIQSVNDDNFEDIALSLFNWQYQHNITYRAFVDALNVNPEDVDSCCDIPFLPISFFKTHKIVTGSFKDAPLVFKSSATTSDVQSIHYVYDQELYLQSLLNGFRRVYGNPADYTILALLPSYLQREGASLVHMVNELISIGGHEHSGFYLNEHEPLFTALKKLESEGQKTLLIGVTFGLLDFVEQYELKLKNTIVMETGGMKGRRKEIIRSDVHAILSERLSVDSIHSEYGMTELLSQAYSTGKGIFTPATTMRVLVRDINDPLDVSTIGSGCLNIIDLANVHSCAFIATDDIGKVHIDGNFEVQGRVDNSALRGCNLMVL